MRAEITKEGKLAIVPESYTEEYAVAAWLNEKSNDDAELLVFFEQGQREFIIAKVIELIDGQLKDAAA